MVDSDRHKQLESLFQETFEAHHKAYMETDGADPDWPLWYAGYLQDRLSGLLGARFTKSELVYLLITLDREVQRLAPGARSAGRGSGATCWRPSEKERITNRNTRTKQTSSPITTASATARRKVRAPAGMPPMIFSFVSWTALSRSPFR